MFANVEGMRIYYERSDGKGTPVVLMHGWGCSVDVMRRVYDRLSRLDKTVIAFDFPGFGRSDLPHRAFSVYDYARVAAGLFAALRSLDGPATTEIYARCPEGGGVAYAVGNRLKKAAAFHIVNAED